MSGNTKMVVTGLVALVAGFLAGQHMAKKGTDKDKAAGTQQQAGTGTGGTPATGTGV